jgi:hypothetical protein
VGARSGVGLRLRLHHSSPLARPRLPPNPQIKKESEWYNFIKELTPPSPPHPPPPPPTPHPHPPPPPPQIKKESEWYNFIKELDRQRARGVQAVESPLLWDDAELESLLKGAAA